MPLDGEPASANAWLLTKVLRDTWGFRGWVVTDAGAVESLTTHGLAVDTADAAVRALNAGVDMQMVTPMKPASFKSLPAALADGRISQSELDIAFAVSGSKGAYGNCLRIPMLMRRGRPRYSLIRLT